MNAAALAICLCISLGGQQPAGDRWFAEDKARHFVTSFVITSLSASAARTAGMDMRGSAYVGAATGTAAGVWKELRDSRHPGETASLRDLVWDLAGVGAGYAVMRQVR